MSSDKRYILTHVLLLEEGEESSFAEQGVSIPLLSSKKDHDSAVSSSVLTDSFPARLFQIRGSADELKNKLIANIDSLLNHINSPK